MTGALYVVHSRPSSPDKEDAYNDWYDDVHLKVVCSVEGVVGARRPRYLGGHPAPFRLPDRADFDNPSGERPWERLHALPAPTLA